MESLYNQIPKWAVSFASDVQVMLSDSASRIALAILIVCFVAILSIK